MAEIYNFFGDIWDYLRETYFDVDFGTYQNFDLSGISATLSQVIIALMLGICLAAFVAFYERHYLGRPVRALLAAGATDEESAKTLAELSCRAGFFLRRNLCRRDSALRKLLRYAGEEEIAPDPTAPGRRRPVLYDRIDLATARFYIPAALCDRAAIRYDDRGSGLRALLLTVLVALVGGGLLIRFLPVLFRLADNMMTALG